MFKQLKKELEFNFVHDSLDLEIPADPQKFYEEMGFLQHPDTGEQVKKLTKYQVKVWRDGFYHKYRLTLKSQKIGLTTSTLMEDFQIALTRARGKEILVIGQSLEHAREHLRTLRKLILNSEKYSDFLIRKSTDLLFRDEVTKVSTMYIRNPDNQNKPTRIIGLGPKEGAVWSWKEVAHIHMSDIAAANVKDDSGLFAAAFSRLANTNGTMHIETPPRGQVKSVWSIYQQSLLNYSTEEQESAKFHVVKVPASEAVTAGLITQEYLDKMKVQLGPQYGEKFEVEFLNPTNTWYEEELFRYDPELELSM